MITVSKYRHQEIAVLGLGRTGVASIFSLLCGQARILAWDDNIKTFEHASAPNKVIEMLCKNAIVNDKLNVNPKYEDIKFANIKAVLVSPGIPTTFPAPHEIITKAREHNIPLISDLELLYETCINAKFVGITGTNGKSTTTCLIGHIVKHAKLPVQVGGNIGISALLLEPLGSQGVYVLETSSFQLELLQNVKFNIAIFLNITPDHLDRHGNFDAYKNAKLKIFDNQGSEDCAVISVDYPETQKIFEQLAQNGRQKLIPISTNRILTSGISIIDGIIYDHIDPENSHQYELGELKRLPGQHNAENIAASYAAARLIGISEKLIISAIKSFQGLEHRIELVLEVDELKFINDSKATNTDATEKALKSFDNIYWIAGGISKDDGIEPLSYLFDKLKHVYLVGQASDKFAKVLNKHNIPYTKAETLRDTLQKIKYTDIKSGIVLLSPACASYDQWKSYEHRGNAFKEIVNEIWGKN